MQPVARTDRIAMIAIVAVGCAATIVFGERIGVHGGEGWDGQSYAAWAGDLPKALADGVTAFQSERMLPSAIVYYALGALGVARTAGRVIVGFQLLDSVALVASAWLLGRIAFALAWSRATTWVAFAAAFLGFANARHALYYPTMTDPSAFALAMAIAWAYVVGRPLVLWIAALASAFTWPALVLVGLLGLALPRATEPPPTTTGRWHRASAVAVGVAVLGFITWWCAFVLMYPRGAERWIDRSHRDLWPLSIASLAIPCAAAAYVVARHDRTWSVRSYLVRVGVWRCVRGVVAIAAIVVASELWRAKVGTQGPGFGWRDLRHYYVATSVHAPLWNLVHHVVYFGPIVVLAIGAWRPIADTAARWGPGAVLALGVVVVTSVSADSRHLLHLLPFAMVATIEATRAWWTPRGALAFIALGVAWSKIWFRIGYVSIHESLDWPDLRWFMHFGPWSNDTTFIIHGVAAVVTAAVLWLVLRGQRVLKNAKAFEITQPVPMPDLSGQGDSAI